MTFLTRNLVQKFACIVSEEAHAIKFRNDMHPAIVVIPIYNDHG